MLWETFCLVFSSERQNPLTCSRISKYNYGQESRTGNPESSEVIKVEIPKFSVGKRRSDLGRDGKRIILQRRPPPDAWLRKAWRVERLG